MAEADARDHAEQTLQLAKDMNPEEIQHYINLHMQMDLEKNPGDLAMPPPGENQAWWVLKNYYKRARDFVVRSSLDKQIAHRFVDSTFFPMIAVQSITDEEKQTVALEASSSMRPGYLEPLSDNLWTALDDTWTTFG